MRDHADSLILQMGYDAKFKPIFIRNARHPQFHIFQEIQYFYCEYEPVEVLRHHKFSACEKTILHGHIQSLT